MMRAISSAISIIGVTLAASPEVPPQSSAAVYSLTEWGCRPHNEMTECTALKTKEERILATKVIAQKCIEHAAKYGCAARITLAAKFDDKPVEPAISPTRTLYAATIPLEQRLVKGKMDVLKETLKTFVLTPPEGAASNKLKGFNKLHLSAGVYFPVDLPTTIPHVYNSTKVEPEVESDKDKSVTWTDPKGDDLSGLGRNNLTIGVFVSTAEEATAKMMKFTPTLSIEYSLEKVKPHPPVFENGRYEVIGECRRPQNPRWCASLGQQDVPAQPQKCLEKYAEENCTIMIQLSGKGKRMSPVEPASNGTHKFYGITLPDLWRLHEKELVGFTESLITFVLYPEDVNIRDETLKNFTSFNVSIGKYDPKSFFTQTVSQGKQSTERKDSAMYWKLKELWPSSKDPSSIRISKEILSSKGDLTIGVLVPNALAKTARMETFSPDIVMQYTLQRKGER